MKLKQKYYYIQKLNTLIKIVQSDYLWNNDKVEHGIVIYAENSSFKVGDCFECTASQYQLIKKQEVDKYLNKK